MPLKLPLSCEAVEKWFWAPDFYGEMIPLISDMHFQIALTSENLHGRFCLSSVQRSEDSWRKKTENRIAVKPKSADDYVERPNKKPLESARNSVKSTLIDVAISLYAVRKKSA